MVNLMPKMLQAIRHTYQRMSHNILASHYVILHHTDFLIVAIMLYTIEIVIFKQA